MSVEQNGERIATRALIVVDGKVLLGKRVRGHGVDQFALVGGKPDEGETLEQTIIREVEEEIGLKFRNPILWKEIPDSKSVLGEIWHIYFFTGEIEGHLVLKKDEISEVIYIGRDDLPNVDIAFNHREVLTQFFNRSS